MKLTPESAALIASKAAEKVAMQIDEAVTEEGGEIPDTQYAQLQSDLEHAIEVVVARLEVK